MSKHAEFEATLRDLPPIQIELLKVLKKAALQEVKKNKKTLDRNELLGIEKAGDTIQAAAAGKPNLAGALCVLEPDTGDNCKDLSKTAFNNLCLAESITNGEEPRFVCDADWIHTIGAEDGQITKFITGYEKWKATFLKSVKWLLQSQAEIKLKQKVTVPLGFRQMNPEGQYVDTVYFEENAWNKAFSKLQPSTKISEQSLWLLAFLFHTGRSIPPSDDDGLLEICTFVGRSIEVRTDNALSVLKIIAYNPDLLKEININTFDDFENKKLLEMSFAYGNPQYISRMLEKKTKIAYDKDSFTFGLFLAMQEDNQPLFDFLLTETIINDQTPEDFLLPMTAINGIKFKNNDAYFFKLLAASKKSLFQYITQAVELDDYQNLLQSFERRLVLQNPFIKKLTLGEETDKKDFLKKVKRTASITTS